jgi:polyhydroxyalkanoate synthesis regulator phasin
MDSPLGPAKFIGKLMDDILESARARKAEELAQDYLQRKLGAIKLIDKLLAEAGSSIEALMVRTLPAELDNIERIDRLTSIAETPRNAMLREIDRRRGSFGEALRRQVQEVEGEFEVVEKTPVEAKSAA